MTQYDSHRADENQSIIVSALRKAGCTVLILSQVGGGCPDLLVGFQDVLDHYNVLLEVKKPGGHLRPEQKEWHDNWVGLKPIVVRTVDEALIAVGKKKGKNG